MAAPAWWVGSLAVTILLVLGWQRVADARLFPPAFLPGPDRAWGAIVAGFSGGNLTEQLLGTVERMLYGWLLASLVGVAVGAVIGSSPRARAYVSLSLEFLRPLPASAVVPVAIALFGLSNQMILGVVAFGTLWPTLLSTVHGFAALDPRLVDVGRVLRLSRLQIVWKLALPNALPDILAGMRLSLSIALILTVVGEILTGQQGLGYQTLLAARSFRSANLFGGVILIGMIGVVSNAALALVEARVLRWRAQVR